MIITNLGITIEVNLTCRQDQVEDVMVELQERLETFIEKDPSLDLMGSSITLNDQYDPAELD